MGTTSRTIAASPSEVWSVLADGWSYGHWVVGTSTIRDVEEGFPAVGRSLHYRIGRGALSKDGHTQVLAVEPERRIELEAHAWPAGSARVELTLDSVATEQGPATRVRLDEHPLRGLAARLHNPLFDLLIRTRNLETLRRLDRLAQRAS